MISISPGTTGLMSPDHIYAMYAQVSTWREYPPVALAGGGWPTPVGSLSTSAPNTWTASISGQSYDNSMYTVRGSSAYLDGYEHWQSFGQWALFGGNSTVHPGCSHWQFGNYNGVWALGESQRYTLDNQYYGDWVTIRLPEAIKLARSIF
jgi:hypothetical protein